MITRIQLVRAVGQFDNVSPPATLDLRRLTLVYAENGRGKTTVAAIARSLATGEALPIAERRRLGATNAPEVVIECTGGAGPACFQNGQWSRTCADVLVFDDVFVDRNVYSGMDVQSEHRQNLHELILGTQGVTLARRVDELAAQIRAHNAEIRDKANAIPAADRYGLNVEEFCGLGIHADIDNAITAAEQRHNALRQADGVRKTGNFATLSMPAIDFNAVRILLSRTVADLDKDAVAAVKAHLVELGEGSEGWVAAGMGFEAETGVLSPDSSCPFCAQSLVTSTLFHHYRAYFGEAYTRLQSDIVTSHTAIASALAGDALAGFERQVWAADEKRRFWSQFTTIPEVGIDTTAIANAWQQARDALLMALRSKQADPLTSVRLGDDTEVKATAFQRAATLVAQAGAALVATNEAISRVKETAHAGSLVTTESELKRLRATKARHLPAISPLCDAYLHEKALKDRAEADKVTAQQALDAHRAAVFPSCQTAINSFLTKLNAGFAVEQVQSQPTGGRPSCTYQLVINSHRVPVGPSTATPGAHTFKNTLSAGDRNTLALALFLAALELDPQQTNRVVILDDPVSSLDKHRRRHTIEEIRRILPNVAQIIVMSHDERFLFDVYDRVPPRHGSARLDTAAIHIPIAPSGSSIEEWDIESEKIGNHDKRHRQMTQFVNGQGGDRNTIAEYIRPHLEWYIRAACPEELRDGETFREFRNRARTSAQSGTPIMSPTQFTELDQLVDYGSEFHHDTRVGAAVPTINDTELRDYVRQTLAFVRFS